MSDGSLCATVWMNSSAVHANFIPARSGHACLSEAVTRATKRDLCLALSLCFSRNFAMDGSSCQMQLGRRKKWSSISAKGLRSAINLGESHSHFSTGSGETNCTCDVWIRRSRPNRSGTAHTAPQAPRGPCCRPAAPRAHGRGAAEGAHGAAQLRARRVLEKCFG